MEALNVTLRRSLVTGPTLTDAMVIAAEDRLGVRLPADYVQLLRTCNGGEPDRTMFPVDFPTSWAVDHIEIRSILGIGGEFGIDSEFGSAYLIEEWEYPDIGVVVCNTPSGGHDTVMLDYRAGQVPKVAYIDEDRVPRIIAQSFTELAMGLERDIQ
jgi:hypothetical protein